MNIKKNIGTAANHYVNQLYKEAVANGLDINEMLAKANIDVDIIGQPTKRIDAEKVSVLQMMIWKALDDEMMGLTTHPVKVGTYYMMGRITVHQPTLEKALVLGKKFYGLVTNAFVIQLEIDDELAFLSFELEAPEKDPHYMLTEMLLLAWHRYASWLIADNLPIVETHFNYQSPAHVTEYFYLYPGIHVFESNKLGFSFPKKYLQRNVEQSEASLKLFMQRCPLELFQRYRADYSLSTEVKKLVVKNLDESVLSIAEAAKVFSMTKRTLTRKLKAEGTSFQQLKDIVRRDQAIAMLTKREGPISQISDAIGFSEPAVFSRAFYNWTGHSPTEYREIHRALQIS